MQYNNETNNNSDIADELNKIQIQQLHNATLNFSNNSLETKKLCITVEVAVFTLLTAIYKEESSYSKLIDAVRFFGILVPSLFYIVDVVLYFYQDRLREKMVIEGNEIRKRYKLTEKVINKNKHRVRKSFFNGSQIMYFGLVIIAVLFPLVLTA
ncbi:hypothetical protein [Aminipila sp.]|uniref:hypothetical protein n=1 Tax=Aminipila sp. TaxID=2060095 RepID=UPI00289F22D0|nr:hypothetical protein [Aminipila sp.]